jgi:hypothetical protein
VRLVLAVTTLAVTTASAASGKARRSASNPSTARCRAGPRPVTALSRLAVSGPSTPMHTPGPVIPVPSSGTASSGSRSGDPPLHVLARAARWYRSMPRAFAIAATAPQRGHRVRPCSRSRSAPMLIPDAAARSRCVRPMLVRRSRISWPTFPAATRKLRSLRPRPAVARVTSHHAPRWRCDS